jgi:sulfate adenylyltransferase subunit 1 (EFTu-like GTPase family)
VYFFICVLFYLCTFLFIKNKQINYNCKDLLKYKQDIFNNNTEKFKKFIEIKLKKK